MSLLFDKIGFGHAWCKTTDEYIQEDILILQQKLDALIDYLGVEIEDVAAKYRIKRKK